MKNELHTKLKLLQLIAENGDYDCSYAGYNKKLTKEGLKEVSTYTNGIGPDIKAAVY